MKTIAAITTTLALLAFAFGGTADAKTLYKHGQRARKQVLKYNQKRGLSTNVRVNALGMSRTQKSLVVAVTNKNSGRTKLLTQNRKTGVVRNLKTKFRTQSQATTIANRKLRRERGDNNGTFAGVDRRGLNPKTDAYIFGSRTDRNERVEVSAKRGGKVKRIDHRRTPTRSSRTVRSSGLPALK